MTWNNVYLSTPNPVGNYQGSAGSTVLSALSMTGGVVADDINVVTLDASGAVTMGSTLSMTGEVNAATVTGSSFSFVGSGNTVHGGFFSGATTTLGSLASVSMSDGQFSIISLSITSCMLAYRSGNTVYKFIAREAEGLSTTP